jgi:hypothetical protein
MKKLVKSFQLGLTLLQHVKVQNVLYAKDKSNETSNSLLILFYYFKLHSYRCINIDLRPYRWWVRLVLIDCFSSGLNCLQVDAASSGVPPSLYFNTSVWGPDPNSIWSWIPFQWSYQRVLALLIGTEHCLTLALQRELSCRKDKEVNRHLGLYFDKTQ